MLTSDAGLRLKHARWAKNLSIRELSEAAGVSTTTIVKIEKGETNVLGQIVYALAVPLGIANPSDLFESDEVAS